MFGNLRDRINAFNAGRELKRFAPQLNKDAAGLNATQLVRLLYSAKWERFFWTKQVQEELIDLAKVVEEVRPNVVLEIGTNTGGTFFVFTKLSGDNAKIISVDLPGGIGGGGYPEYKTNFFRSFGTDHQQLYFIKSNSQDGSTYIQVEKILNGSKVDFLFIDGDHSYEGVRRDFKLYSPLVNEGGTIAFHDIKPYPTEHWIKVRAFWEEIKKNYEHKEFLFDSIKWGGIGVLTYRHKNE